MTEALPRTAEGAAADCFIACIEPNGAGPNPDQFGMLVLGMKDDRRYDLLDSLTAGIFDSLTVRL
jgi:hypothetical protein